MALTRYGSANSTCHAETGRVDERVGRVRLVPTVERPLDVVRRLGREPGYRRISGEYLPSRA
jgi:hypothetical protein